MTYDWHSRCNKIAHDGGFKREEAAEVRSYFTKGRKAMRDCTLRKETR